MKKIMAISQLVIILVSTTLNSYAASKTYLKSINYSKSNGQEIVYIYSSNYNNYKTYYLSNPLRLVFDLPDNTISMKSPGTIRTNGTIVKNIRYSQYSKKLARVVLDLSSKSEYKLEKKSGYIKMTFGSVTNTTSGTSGSSGTSGINRGDVDRPVPVTNSISYSSVNNIDNIAILGTNLTGYSAYRLTDPDRIIVDVPNCTVPANQQDMPGSLSLIKNIKYTQLDTKTARITIETNGQPPYTLTGGQDQLLITVESPTYKNIQYSKVDNNIKLTLMGAKLTEIVQSNSTDGSVDGNSTEIEDVKPLYTDNKDASGKKYTVTFPAGLADLGSGILKINDGMLDNIEIVSDLQSQTASIIFTSDFERKFEITTNPDTNVTVISITKMFAKTDKLVVIDAGHGGYDPGAVYAGVKEKDLNLKVALRVNEILKSRGINTYMTRSTDTFVPLYDRANIANDMNAVLFLSIHHNAYNTSEKGTETLYYPSELSKAFANIIQGQLPGALGTKSKGIIQRPNLVVLHATKMPAALAELGYITNSEDREKILSDSFAENAATALCDSVVKALDTIVD
jgi:N-acetylmuramoyl-L-alanine amidase